MVGGINSTGAFWDDGGIIRMKVIEEILGS